MEKKRSVQTRIWIVEVGIIFIAYALNNLIEDIFISALYDGSPFGINVLLILYIIFNLLLLIVAFGLLKMQHWGRVSALPVAVVIIALALNNIAYQIKTSHELILNIDTLFSVLSLFFGLLIIYVFTHPKVKEQFK